MYYALDHNNPENRRRKERCKPMYPYVHWCSHLEHGHALPLLMLHTATVDLPTGVVLPTAESHRLLGELLRASIGKTPHLRHAWKPRDLVCWDNRRVLHSGTPRARMVGRRLIHRIRMTSAERPVGARREAAL